MDVSSLLSLLSHIVKCLLVFAYDDFWSNGAAANVVLVVPFTHCFGEAEVRDEGSWILVYLQ